MQQNEVPTNLLDALYVREMCNGSVYMTHKEAVEQHLDMIYDGTYGTKKEKQAAVEHEKALLEAGNQYFEQGYRFHQSDRNTHWNFDVPAEALQSRIVSAGHIATNEAKRLLYVTKK